MKLLFASSEIFPLAKTGGLADVAGALPVALHRAKIDLRLLMPAYRGIAEQADAKQIANLGDPFGLGDTILLEGRLPDSHLPLWLVDNPSLFDRDGGPYQDGQGTDWPDNDMRFGLLGWTAARLCQANSPLAWKPDILHTHDWQTGLASAYLKAWGEPRPGLVFTIHNMAYQGLFPPALVPRLGLPWSFYTMDGFEYWSQLSYLKAGLVFADKLTTVSPTYAREIQTSAYGFGMQGLLSYRAHDLHGILNGADYAIWDPSNDRELHQTYGIDDRGSGKAANKAALQRELGLPQIPDAPLLVVISRLSDQKGMDLLLSAMPAVIAQGGQLALLGSGQRGVEDAFLALTEACPTHVAMHIGYSEALAHRLQAGGDIVLMPSRFEPCGLTQLYAMRYGTLPVVHRTGGLADTVVDATYDAMLAGTATGFVFEQPTASAFQWSIERAIGLYRNPDQWARLQATAMRQDFGWDRSAAEYLELYRSLRPNSFPSHTETNAVAT
ncbi:MAG TPA: glycogen synthase GlgA [Telmatospirillum sp.]|nr:glycogen synthase GlgA [Telmatospirillum sp.]